MLRSAASPLTIWTARTFDTALHSLRRLRDNPDGKAVRLLVSHVREDSPTLAAADVAFLEPPLAGRAWVDWALQVCEQDGVDVLWVTREASAAAAARQEFAAVGTRLLTPSSAALDAAATKSAVYLTAEDIGVATPPWTIATGPAAAATALAELAGVSPVGVCVKPDSGQGAESVHRIVDAWEDLPRGVDLPAQMWLAHVARNPDRTWLMMPWLPGAEHSVDVLRSRDGQLLAAAVRTKLGGSREQVTSGDPALVAASEQLLDALEVAPLGNVQWRDLDGAPVLLEVNPRPSGGLWRSAEVLGVDLLWAAIRQELAGSAGLPHTPTLVPNGVTVRSTSVGMTVPVPVLGLAPALPDIVEDELDVA